MNIEGRYTFPSGAVEHRPTVRGYIGRTVDASPVTRSTSRRANGRTHTPWSCANPATMALSHSNGSSTARPARESCATPTSMGTSTIETTPERSVGDFHRRGRAPVSRLILRAPEDTPQILLFRRYASDGVGDLWTVVVSCRNRGAKSAQNIWTANSPAGPTTLSSLKTSSTAELRTFARQPVGYAGRVRFPCPEGEG